MFSQFHWRTAIVIFALIAAVCLSIPASVFAATFTVDIPGLYFDPDTVVITVGDDVVWTNYDGIDHTTTSDGGFWDSGNLVTGASYVMTFSDPGAYPYHCSIHPAMTGVVIVLEGVYDIDTLYQNIDIVNGLEVSVFGQYTNPNDGKLVHSYFEYFFQQLMEPQSVLFIEGALPDAMYWYGGTMIVTGTVSFVSNPYPVNPNDTIHIILTASSYEYLLGGGFGLSQSQGGSNDDGEEIKSDDDFRLECDPCKFAILISGGGSAAENRPGFWEDLENLYKYKTDATENGGGYCKENVKVIYYDGNSGDPAVVHDTLVDAATEANIQAAHEEIARKIAQCNRDNKKSTVQKMVTNHGADGDGIVLLNNNYLSGGELREMQQMLIDSCATYFYDEFTQCYGGQIADSLKNLDDKSKTEIHVNSAAGSGSVSLGDPDDGSTYLQKKIERLIAGDDYEAAVDSAKKAYSEYVNQSLQEANNLIDQLNESLDEIPFGSELWWRLWRLLQKLQALRDKLQDSADEGSPSWVRYQFEKYCEWKKVVIPKGGQANFEFKGQGACGNVTIWIQLPDGTKKRVKVWNWNLPGSNGYQEGYENRVLNGSADSSTTYWIHNDNGKFTVTVDALNDMTLDESASNQIEFAGFSMGGNDGSSDEFIPIPAEFFMNEGVDSIGFNLSEAPALFGFCGTGVYAVSFDVSPSSPYWNDMELVIDVLYVVQPGMVVIFCEYAEIQMTNLVIDQPGRYTVHLGQIFSTGHAQIYFDALQDGACYEIDSWGLRSLVSTWPEAACGDADGSGGVDIDDVVYLIAYIFSGGPEPVTMDAGDADCSGGIDIDDVVYLIAYIFSGGPEPCASCD